MRCPVRLLVRFTVGLPIIIVNMGWVTCLRSTFSQPKLNRRSHSARRAASRGWLRGQRLTTWSPTTYEYSNTREFRIYYAYSWHHVIHFPLSTALDRGWLRGDGRKRSQSRTFFDFESVSVRRHAVSRAVWTFNTKCMLSTLGASPLTARCENAA